MLTQPTSRRARTRSPLDEGDESEFAEKWRGDIWESISSTLRRRGESVLGSWGKAMRDALRNKESLERTPCAYPRS